MKCEGDSVEVPVLSGHALQPIYDRIEEARQHRLQYGPTVKTKKSSSSRTLRRRPDPKELYQPPQPPSYTIPGPALGQLVERLYPQPPSPSILCKYTALLGTQDVTSQQKLHSPNTDVSHKHNKTAHMLAVCDSSIIRKLINDGCLHHTGKKESGYDAAEDPHLVMYWKQKKANKVPNAKYYPKNLRVHLQQPVNWYKKRNTLMREERHHRQAIFSQQSAERQQLQDLLWGLQDDGIIRTEAEKEEAYSEDAASFESEKK
eukprot:TRINITY_DN3541_c0_g1_i2.p3 TRINITY_DN3541_c0_g1~~TRINITY_DN3541_c0_g1_i2.p3  ORF type:complete len:260 (+),score=34.71 TRINITY_DN3541_c0_g1_i2:1453-2232(+)